MDRWGEGEGTTRADVAEIFAEAARLGRGERLGFRATWTVRALDPGKYERDRERKRREVELIARRRRAARARAPTRLPYAVERVPGGCPCGCGGDVELRAGNPAPIVFCRARRSPARHWVAA